MYKSFLKRLIDLFIAIIVLVAITPFMIPVVIVLLLTGEHYVWYLQERVGKDNKPFMIWKFATMLKASPSLGTGSLTTKNDPRVFPFGRFLRKTKINELPQIINVLNGTMSIVGPRPQMEVDFLKFPEDIQEVVYKAKPGITGIGSLIFRDEEKWLSHAQGDIHEFYKTHIAPYKGALEEWYHDHISFRTDMLLIFLTAWAIVSPGNQLVYRVFRDLPKKPVELV